MDQRAALSSDAAVFGNGNEPSNDSVDVGRDQSNIGGSWSGNRGDNNVFGSNYSIQTINVLFDKTNFGVGNRGGVFGVEGRGQECRPYRLIPYAKNRGFTGRKNLLELVRRYSEHNTHNRIALYGLGGSGKTQIALEYIYQRANESDCHIFWVQGSGLLKFSKGFQDVAQNFQIPPASVENDEEGFLLGIRRWLEGPNSGDWILVIDNADNDADFSDNNGPIARFLSQGAKGTIILTTRSKLVASRQGCKMVEVGKMEEDDALDLFSTHSGRSSWGGEEKRAIEGILAMVHHLPLAIIGAAAFMIETGTPPSTYWDILHESDERAKKLLSQQFCDIQREANTTESILGTYFATFDHITQQMPPAARLLRLIGFFDRQNIPEELLSQCGLEGMDDTVEFRQAIGKLLGFSLVTLVKCQGKIFYELHRLVQLSLHAYIPAEESSQGRAAALRVVSRLPPRDHVGWRGVGQVYIPHGLAVTEASRDPITEELGFQMGMCFMAIGSYNNAGIQFYRCIMLRSEEKEYDWDGDGLSRVLLLGRAFICQGKASVAEGIFRSLLEGAYEPLGLLNPIVLHSIFNLATVLHGQGKYDESERMNQRALQWCEKNLGPDHSDTLTSISNLALVLEDQGKYDEAETMNLHALERREKILGPDHPDTLTSINNLALALYNQGKYGESELMNRRALEQREQILGPDHPSTLISVNNLAQALQKQGKYDESETANRRALEGRERNLGLDHPHTLSSVNNLALVLQDQGKWEESETMSRRALEGHAKILGLDHPSTLLGANNLASALRPRGRYSRSEQMNWHALKWCEKILGPSHPNAIISTVGTKICLFLFVCALGCVVIVGLARFSGDWLRKCWWVGKG